MRRQPNYRIRGGIGAALDTCARVDRILCGCRRPPASAQGASTWFLAEGANNANFAQDILIGNPSSKSVTVTLTLLPQSDAITPTLVKTFTMAPTSRLTVNLSKDFKLNGSSSARVSAVVSGTSTPADIVVERTMFFGGDLPLGSRGGSIRLARTTRAA